MKIDGEECDRDYPKNNGVEIEGQITKCQRNVTLHIPKPLHLDNEDIEDVDLYGASNNVQEGKCHRKQRNADFVPCIVKPKKNILTYIY